MAVLRAPLTMGYWNVARASGTMFHYGCDGWACRKEHTYVKCTIAANKASFSFTVSSRLQKPLSLLQCNLPLIDSREQKDTFVLLLGLLDAGIGEESRLICEDQAGEEKGQQSYAHLHGSKCH